MRQIKDIARASGFTLKEHFMDEKKWFCLALLSPWPLSLERERW
jgi:hypothetical protein